MLGNVFFCLGTEAYLGSIHKPEMELLAKIVNVKKLSTIYVKGSIIHVSMDFKYTPDYNGRKTVNVKKLLTIFVKGFIIHVCMDSKYAPDYNGRKLMYQLVFANSFYFFSLVKI